MIKVQNQKSIAEINKLREQWLYNAPFAVQESANNIKVETPDTKELEDKIQGLQAKIDELESKEVSAEAYDDSALLDRIDELEKKLTDSESTVADYVAKTESQAKTIDELNADLDVLVGGSDE
mgnify:CR=1 FL=1